MSWHGGGAFCQQRQNCQGQGHPFCGIFPARGFKFESKPESLSPKFVTRVHGVALSSRFYFEPANFSKSLCVTRKMTSSTAKETSESLSFNFLMGSNMTRHWSRFYFEPANSKFRRHYTTVPISEKQGASHYLVSYDVSCLLSSASYGFRCIRCGMES